MTPTVTVRVSDTVHNMALQPTATSNYPQTHANYSHCLLHLDIILLPAVSIGRQGDSNVQVYHKQEWLKNCQCPLLHALNHNKET
jgi:hypothetical protein